MKIVDKIDGISLPIVLISSALLLVITSMIGVLVISEVGSFNRTSKTKKAYALAKEGMQIALANINDGKSETEVRAIQGTTGESGSNDIYQVTSWNQSSRVLTVQGRAQVRNETDCRFDVDGDERDEYFVCKNISTKLIEDPDTFKYEESFSSDDYKNGATTAEWSGDGQVYLASTEIPDRTTGDMFAAYTKDPLSAGTTNVIKVDDLSDVSGFFGDPDPDEILIANTQSLSDGTQERARIESVDYAAKEITLKTPVQYDYSGTTSITRIPQYTSVSVTSRATLTANGWNATDTTGGIFTIKVKNTLQIENGSKIDMTARGYGQSQGPGAGKNGEAGGGGNAAASGAGYGGTGGNGGRNYIGDIAGGSSYGSDSSAVYYMGSGGGHYGSSGINAIGGSGGGLVIINANSVNLYGSIQSNGRYAENVGEALKTGSGGGAGGGISVATDALDYGTTGIGIISAAGGGGSRGLREAYGGETNGSSGLDGIGGTGARGTTNGGVACGEGASGGTPGPNPGNGGKGSDSATCGAGNGTNSSGGGGAQVGGWSGGGGGAAGRIGIKYGTVTGLSDPSGFVSAPGLAVTGPWAYYTNATITDFGDGSDGALIINSDTNLSDTSTDTTGYAVFDSDSIAQSKTISGSSDNIRKATIYVYPAEANSYGNLTSLSMSTRTVDDVFDGEIEGTNGFDVSSGNGPYIRTFTWDNENLGNNLQYSFNLTTDDNTKTPRIDHIKIVYIAGPNFKIDYSTWRAD